MSVLLLAPLRVEAVAVRGSGRVLRTGMGRHRARIAAARALAVDADGIAVAGVAGGVAPGLLPGDVVCATDLRGDDGTTAVVPGGALLAAALRRQGLRVHVGTIVSTGRILPPSERERLDGALAVDMESAWLAAAAGGRPLAILRAIADPAGRRLADPRIVPEGIRALRSLRQSRGVLADWAAALGSRTLVLADPRAPDIVELVRNVDVVLTGSKELASNAGVRGHFVRDATDVDLAWLRGADTVGVIGVPQEVIDALAGLGRVEIEAHVATTELVS